MQREIASVLLIGAAVALWPARAAAQIPSTATYSCDFENNYCDFGEQSKIGDAPPSIARRSSLVPSGRNGSWAVRLHTEPGDDQVHGSGTWERDDLTKSADASYCNEGQEEWWALSVMFPSDYVYPPGPDGGVVMDFHHSASNGLPNFSVDTMPGGRGMRIRGQGGATIDGGQYTSWITDPYGAVGDVTRNQWYDFVFHIKWSATSAGFSEAWLNGKKVHSYSGATLYSGISCYLKLANYHGPFGKASSIIFDRVVRGAGATDVALGPLDGVTPTGSTPTPTPMPTPTPTPTPPPGTIGSAPASLTMDSSSYTIAAGSNVTFTARVLGNSGTPTGTMNFRADGATIGGCGAIAVSNGVATCSTTALTSGGHPITGIYSGDSTYGAGQAGPITQSVNASSAPPAATTPTPGETATSLNVQGLWWRPSESGWGVNLTQQGEILFATWFTYDASGNGLWLSMSNGAKTGANIYSGALYRTSGPSYNAAAFDPSQVSRTPVGTATFTFSDANNGTFTATVDGAVVTKPITRMIYSAPVPTCAAGGSAGATPNYQDLWWRSGGSESGWGVNITHQGDILFMTWFTYGPDGQGMWLVGSSVAKTGEGTYSGILYRTWGPAFNAEPFDPARVTRVPVGIVSFTFSDAANGTMTYTVDGATQSKPITRLLFATPTTVCR